MKFSSPILSVVLATALGATSLSTATAQQVSVASPDPVADALRQRGEAYRRAPDTAQTPEELRITSALNAEILDQNNLAEREERARLDAYSKAQAEYQAELERVEQERQRIAREAENNQARYRAQQEAHARARANWQACRDGDRSRCIPQR